MVRSAYEADCRFYADRPTGRIKFYFVPDSNPYFESVNLFWPKKECLQNNVPPPVGEIVDMPRPWRPGFGPVGLDGTPVGTDEDFIGRGVYRPDAPPTCEELYYRGFASLAVEAPSSFVYAFTGDGGAEAAVESPSEVVYRFRSSADAEVAVEALSDIRKIFRGHGMAEVVIDATADTHLRLTVDDTAEVTAEALSEAHLSRSFDGTAEVVIEHVDVTSEADCNCCGGDCLPEEWCLALQTGEEECECLFGETLCGGAGTCTWYVRMSWDGFAQQWQGTSPAVVDCLPETYWVCYCHTDEIEPGVNWYLTLERWEGGVLIQYSTVTANDCGNPFDVTWPNFFGMGGVCGGFFEAYILLESNCTNSTNQNLCVTVADAADDGCEDCEVLNGSTLLTNILNSDDYGNWISDPFFVCGLEFYWSLWLYKATGDASLDLIPTDPFGTLGVSYYTPAYTPQAPTDFTLVHNALDCEVPLTVLVEIGDC